MFPLSFPYSLLKNARVGDRVYDPFCGRGTTNFAARMWGLESYGTDSNPVAHAIAQAKFVKAKPDDIAALCFDILLRSTPKDFPRGDFWELAYHPDTLVDICAVREYLNSKQRLSSVEIALRAICLGILHGPLMKTEPSYLSNQMPRTFATKPAYSVNYWNSRGMRPAYVSLLSLVKRRADYIFNQELPSKTSGRVLLSDSRTLAGIPEEGFDWVITSPPYFGMVTYEQDQWLRNWFLGGVAEVDYSANGQLRHWSERAFNEDLSKVWSNVAQNCKPKARMIIRFGALPSKSEKTPTELIKESIYMADVGWKITTIRGAGKPKKSYRQANQFKSQAGSYVEEVDIFTYLAK